VGAKYHQGEKEAILTYEMYTYRIKKYIGAYFAALNGVEAVIFTGGIGENDILTRKLTCRNLDALGILLDEAANAEKNHPATTVEIQAAGSKVKILVIPTNEELAIAEETYELVKGV
ncbi:MAG TPA: acetate kinase, partial [Chryseobacterium sp.]|nr:acetate kinase [Chryseobacterium sp.]